MSWLNSLTDSKEGQGGSHPPRALMSEETLQKCPLGCPDGKYNMMKRLLGCPSDGQNAIKCLTTSCTLVPYSIHQVPFLLFSPLPLKHPKSTSG